MRFNPKIYLSNLQKRKTIFIAVGITVMLALLFWLLVPSKSIDVSASDEDLPYYVARARLYDGKELFKAIGGEQQYDQISKDIYTFGKNSYKAYINGTKRVIGFSVDKNKIVKNGSVVSFEGKYGSSSSRIKIKIDLLKNDRIKTSITDAKNGQNIDSKLPSNSKTNQFMSKLPIYNKGYNIYYYTDNTKLRVDINGVHEDIKIEALDYLTSQTDTGYVNDENVEIYYVDSSFSSEHTDYLQTYIKPQNAEEND